jgi:hypothetical protein
LVNGGLFRDANMRPPILYKWHVLSKSKKCAERQLVFARHADLHPSISATTLLLIVSPPPIVNAVPA